MTANTNRLTVPEAEEVLDKYFPVLDYGFVALTDYMGGDASIERAARVSYGGGTRAVSDRRNLLRYLYRHKHTSPFEMCEVAFHIGLPIFVMRQLVRHRTANLNEYSGRYSIMPLMFYTPDREQVSVQSSSNKQGRGKLIDEVDYEYFRARLKGTREQSSWFYQGNLGMNMARELARIDLPLSTYTYCYWKMDLRNLLHMVGLRSDPHAQWEIRAFSDVMAGIVQRVAPISFEAFQDYQMNSVAFSQAELEGVRALAEVKNYWGEDWADLDPHYAGYVNTELIKHELGKREINEFWKKLERQEKRDFSLDLASAKPPEYFEKLMKDHAIETPD